MHAVSNDPAAFERPCVYLQLDEGSDASGFGGGGGGGDEEGEEEEEEGELSAELRLVPGSEGGLGAVEAIFKAMCDCSALNPDSELEGAVCCVCVLVWCVCV
jgi:hypothetical protein